MPQYATCCEVNTTLTTVVTTDAESASLIGLSDAHEISAFAHLCIAKHTSEFEFIVFGCASIRSTSLSMSKPLL
eukprot:scaffold46299_cov190-Skeletonema_marinoi.AAC.1